MSGLRVLFINDSTTYANWGGRAATISLRAMISRVGGDIVKTITIGDLERSSLEHHDAVDEVNPSDPSASRETLKLFIPPIALKLRRRILRDSDSAREHSPVPQTWGDYDRCVERVLGKKTPWPGLLKTFEDIDVAVVFGNGDIYGNHLLPRTLLFLSFLIKRRFNKPIVMVDHSADLDHPDLRRVAEGVYPLFDDVVFRDQISADRCRTLCTGRVAADTAFWFKPASRRTWTPIAGRPAYFDVWPDTASLDPSGPYVCVGGSSLFDTANKDIVTNGYARLITQLRASYSGQIVLTVSDPVDYPIFHPLAERFGLPLIGATTPVQQAVDILGNADAYVGGRFHPSVFALRGGTPVVALSAKTFKMRALTEAAELPSATFDALDLTQGTRAIRDRLLTFLDQGNALRSRLRAWAEEMAASSWENVAYLRRLQEYESASSAEA